MPRTARTSSETRYHHIMVQGINRSYIFDDDKMKTDYLRIIRETLEEADIALLAFCIMSNHGHFLIYSEQMDDLSNAMRKANTRYAKHFNKRLERVGYVFRDRYRSEGIVDPGHLLRCIIYIHNNPLAAGICHNRGDYRWTSWHEYMSPANDSGAIADFLRSLSVDIGQARRQLEILHDNRYEEKWLEHTEYDPGMSSEVLATYLERTGSSLDQVKREDSMLRELVIHIREQTGISLRMLAQLLDINRERLRLIMSKPPSP